jgi:exonuclease SbcC
LQGFIDENESNRDNVLGIVEIFKEIEIEEKERISELFGKNSPISKYFNEITGGFYEEVMFNQETGEVEAKRKDGKILKTMQLSGGTYDQLYLSIRLALGEKLLKDKKGFFIMDDPFIKADTGRLQNQMSILKRVSSKLEWQILYFTAKDEVKNALKEDVESNKVRYIEISGFSL